MGHSKSAITKGVIGERLAEIYFLQKGFTVLKPETHEEYYDFIISSNGDYYRVQVKTNVNSMGLIRFRNKRGGKNTSYRVSDYDILCGVDVNTQTVYLFDSEDINEKNIGETLTVARQDNKPLSNHKRVSPYHIEGIFNG